MKISALAVLVVVGSMDTTALQAQRLSADGAMQTFGVISDLFLSDVYFKFQPTIGTYAGLHQYDTQLEVSPFGELTYERALRSILRQDPQVLMMGEIRDDATASVAVQAALSGHRLISTLHAATPAGAVARLIEMGVAPYQITSAVFGIVGQRLLRRKSKKGYAGRVPVAEFVRMDEPLRRAVAQQGDLEDVRKAYVGQPGYSPMRTVAQELVRQGISDEGEVRRVLGESM